jgi:lipoprotein-releasing system permease protein
LAYVLKKEDLARALVVLAKALEAYPGRTEEVWASTPSARGNFIMSMLFIAKRIYRGGELGKVSTSAVRIATIGVAVGIMIMVISLCVTSGFQSEIKSKVASLIGHVQIVNNQSLYRTQTHPIQITDSLRDRLLSIPEVERVQRFALCRGMLKTDNAFRGVLLRGVDADFDTTFISTHLIEGCMPSF